MEYLLKEHKDVKEDKEREPFYFRGHRRPEAVKGTTGEVTTQQANKRETLLYKIMNQGSDANAVEEKCEP